MVIWCDFEVKIIFIWMVNMVENKIKWMFLLFLFVFLCVEYLMGKLVVVNLNLVFEWKREII